MDAGPWRRDVGPWDETLVDGNGHPVAGVKCVKEGWTSKRPDADAELIALAPEMAAAILALVDDWNDRLRRAGIEPNVTSMEPSESTMYDLAERLRKIGGAS